MKCLEKDRSRRYDTANGLAADLNRHLNNEPVVARPPSTAYRFQKAFRRNKLVFAATGAVVLALLIGLVVSLWQASVAKNARQTAQHEAYVAKMNLAQAAWDQNNVSRLEELLDETAAAPIAYRVNDSSRTHRTDSGSGLFPERPKDRDWRRG